MHAHRNWLFGRPVMSAWTSPSGGSAGEQPPRDSREGRPSRRCAPSAYRAQSLATVGAETIRGDLGNPEPLRAAFSDAHCVFSVQPNSGQAVADVTTEDEVRFGTAVADIAEPCGVAHLVYSSADTADSTTGVDHLDTKNRIEAHIRNLDIAATIIRPTTFMELLAAPKWASTGDTCPS